jgi:flagellin
LDIGSLGAIVTLQQGKTASNLQTDVTRLSTGLRINSAADDPSGLAISQSLQSRVNGLDQGVESVQTATNALTVADGALATIDTLLQRIRTLVVAANSTLESANDVSDDQTEITTLVQEINHVSTTTQFNGKTLLDGSLSSGTPLGPQLLIPTNGQLASGDTLISTLPGYQAELAESEANDEQFVQQITVDSYDATTGQLTVGGTIEGDSSFGPAQPFTFQVQAGTNYSTQSFGPPTPGSPTFEQYDQNFNPVLSFNIGILNPSDVGATSILLSIPGQTKAPGQNAQINDGSAEGSLVFIDVPAVNAQNLGVNEITLSTTGDSLVNEAAEYRVDYGIQQLSTIRAQIGAQIVALQGDVTSTQNTAVQLQSSESNIADLNVGEAVTQFTLDQIRSSIQTAVLSKLYSAAPAVLSLVQGNLTNTNGNAGP